MYEVESDVPVPEQRVHSKYPFRTLEVGDSFLVPFDGDSEHSLIANRVCTAARLAGKTHNIKFTTRRLNVGVRVWRVS